MWSALSSVARLMACGTVALFAAAILIGRATDGGKLTAVRFVEPDRPIVINRALQLNRRGGIGVYDPATGHVSELAMPEGQTLDYASVSPWRDSAGDRQVVGLWSRFVDSGCDRVLESSALARLSFPEGRVLDTVQVAINPVGMPCWYPDTSSRVLYAGADGRLYQVEFDDDRHEAIHDNAPRPLSWEAEPRLGEQVLLGDPCWPVDPRFNRTLLVSLRRRADGINRPAPPAELWWLRLGADGLSVEDAGRLIDPPAGLDTTRSEFAPSVVATPEGSLVLAYLSNGIDQADWALHVSPLRIDEQTGSARASTGVAYPLESTTRPSTPSFSSDGRWVACLMPDRGPYPRAFRRAIRDLGPAPGTLAARVVAPPARAEVRD